MNSNDTIKKQVNHCTIAVSDWMAGGCDVNDIPRPEMAVLLAFQKEWLKDMEQPAQRHAGVTDALVDAYCKAWAQSFAAANPHHTVKMTAEDRQHIVAGLKAALAAQPQPAPVQQPEPVVCMKCGVQLGKLHLATGDGSCPSGWRVQHSDCAPQPAPILPNSLPAFKQYLQECEDCLINPDVSGAFIAGWQAMAKQLEAA